MPFPFLAAIPAIAGIANSIINSIQSRKNQKREFAANQELAQYQYSKDLEMWNKQNEYNSPEAQMERYRKGGLNPLLIYSQGNPGNAATLPKYNAPQANYSGILPGLQLPEINMIGMYQDMQIKNAQLNQIRTATEVAQKTGVQRELQNQFLEYTAPDRAGILGSKAQYSDDIYQAQLAKMNQERERISGLMPYQLDIQKETARRETFKTEKLFQDIAKTKSGIEWQNLQNEWYITKMIGQFGLGILNTLPKMFPAGRAAKVATQYFNPKNQVRYNSPTQWQQYGK